MNHSNRVSQPNKFIWYASSFLLTALAIWIHLGEFSHWIPEAPGGVSYFLAAAIFALLSYSLSKLLTLDQSHQSSHYRTAFLLSMGLGLVLNLGILITKPASFQWEMLVITSLAAFIGSFIASNLSKGWWENNAAPSEKVAAEVRSWHKSMMGIKKGHSALKRLADVVFALLSLILSLPLCLLIVPIIWLEDPGPVLFVKNSVGRNGVTFKQFKFRSMILNAEEGTGPISGYENDERVLFSGEFLRKTALDELPQLINILLGDMSYVGPRPQRTVLVHGYLQRLPEYARRHQVRPGLAGLAQVVDAYDITPEEKLAWDLVYIENANLWLDVKLVFSAFFLVFALRWLPKRHPEAIIQNLLGIQKPQVRKN